MQLGLIIFLSVLAGMIYFSFGAGIMIFIDDNADLCIRLKNGKIVYGVETLFLISVFFLGPIIFPVWFIITCFGEIG